MVLFPFFNQRDDAHAGACAVEDGGAAACRTGPKPPAHSQFPKAGFRNR
jgi:hypothetical protein